MALLMWSPENCVDQKETNPSFPNKMEPPSYSKDPIYSLHSMLTLLALRTAFSTMLATRRVPSSRARATLELHDLATQYNATTLKIVEDFPTGFKM